ncbi:MAG: DUF4445 domain-containing protein [Ruminococcaceae bacterium]|nr:DUF4445 domain-containing protein [Oscillospiraceae bacterium]
MISNIHHEKYHDEFSMSVAVVCDIMHTRAVAAFYDVKLDRLIARSVVPIGKFNDENASAEVARLVFMCMREYGIPAAAITKIGVAAPHDLACSIEESIEPTDMFLRPDTEVVVLPFVSMYADSRFAASLAAVAIKKGSFIASFGRMLDLAYYDGEKLLTASVELTGAFDATGIESGMSVEYGAIDEVRRESDRTLCYCVIGDIDACGIAVPAFLDAACIMLDEGVIDSDGIMTDRDQFYLGEDFYLTQKDVRVLQSDKASAAAAIECFLRRCGTPSEVYLCGDALAGEGIRRLERLGVISSALAEKAQYCRSYTEQGTYSCISAEDKLTELASLIRDAEDISAEIYDGFDDMYITNLQF